MNKSSIFKNVSIIMKVIFCILIILSIELLSQSKINNNWNFKDHIQLSFNTSSGFPIILNGYQTMHGTQSTISDINGKELFYTAGYHLCNRLKVSMKNSRPIFGRGLYQPYLITPSPSENSIYYVFSISPYDTTGFRYSIVDMRLDNGLGEVVIKNEHIFDPVCDKLTAFYHENNKDIWILTHQWNSNNFLAFSVTEKGINKNPVISSVGTIHKGGYRRDGIYVDSNNNIKGQMKFSHDGMKVATAIYDTGFIEIFDFDRRTGLLSNDIRLKLDSSWGMGSLEFSRDNSKLYVSVFWPFPSKIYQFDLTSGIADSIIKQIFVVDTFQTNPFLQMGPDGRIYVAPPGEFFLSYITYPNNKGDKCRFVRNGIYLKGNQLGYGLQNSIQGIFQINCSPESFDYPIFKKEDNLTFLKDSKLIGEAIRLSPNNVNQRGAVWHNRKVDVTKSFTCDFSMRFSQGDNKMFDDGSLPGADGLAFVIQNNDILSIGETGGGLGYHGIPNSIAIEFDLYWNKKDDIMPIDDPNGNHIAVQCNGIKPNTADHSTTALLGIAKDILTIKADSTLYYVRIKYEPDTLMVFMDTINYFVEPVLKIGNFRPEKLLNLEEGKRAYVGFTSSTGASVQNNDIEEWYFCNQTEEIINDVAEEKKNISNDISIFSISPNPAGEYIEIALSSPRLKPWVAGVDAIKIFNLLGECVMSAGGAGGTHPLIPSQEGNVRIDVSSLPAGLYFVRVGDWVGRFVKI